MADACLALSTSSIDALLPLIEATPKFNCNEPTKPLNSPNKEYFEKLLAKGTSAPLEEFLRLWDPEGPEFEEDPYFFRCQKKPYTPMTKLDKTKHLAEECKPDTLYTWGPTKKLDTMLRTMPDAKKWGALPNPFVIVKDESDYEKDGVEGALFLSLSPAVSFGYGDTLVRIKVKRGIKFAPMNYDSKTKIGFSTGNVHEFVINRTSMIESWSYGTPEIYDELVRDIKRHLTNKRTETLTSQESGDRPYTQADGYLHALYENDGMDGTNFNEKALKNNLLKLIAMILKGEGKVLHPKGVCRNYDEHYSTNKPIWFNPN